MSNNTQEPRNWINSLFTKVLFPRDNNQSLLIGIGAKKDEYIKELQAMPADNRGWINFTLGTKKDDKSKMSAWWEERQNNSGQQVNNTNYQQRPTNTSQSASSIDDLPF